MSSPPRADLRGGIARSAAFRLTLRFAGAFVACLLVADVVFGVAARWVMREQAQASIEQSLGTLEAAFADGGAPAVAEAIRAVGADDAEGDGLLFGHQDPEGGLLAGGLAVAAPRAGWSEGVPSDADPDEGFWIRSARLPDGTWLNVAASQESYHDVVEMMLAGALWTVATALPLALVCGALLSRAVLGRLAEIAGTAEGVRKGALSQRAPVSGRGDEFDRLAADLNAMLDTIETLTRNLRNVSVGIAHELRGPLARIRNRLDAIDPSDPGAHARAIESSLAEIDSTLATFDALLKIGQIEAKAQRTGFEVVDLSALVADLAEVYAPVAAEQGKHVDARIAANVALQGDRPLLTQMISNLLENAIEHTPQGTRIRVELDTVGQGPRLVVEDDGPGIPAAETERVFERFYRLDGSPSNRGTGLGLSLVKSICGLHGFILHLDPTASGARFEISM